MAAKLKAAISAVSKAAPTAGRDAVGLLGLALVVRGVALIYAPAAWIFAGLALIAYVVITTRAKA